MNHSKHLNHKYTMVGVLFLVPAIGLYLLFMAYPLTDVIPLSLSSWTGFGDRKFVGLANYQDLLRDKLFFRALKNTIYFAFFSSIISVALGVILAWLNMYISRFIGNVFRTILFAPNMIAPTITGLMFLFIFTEDIGLLNGILKAVGLGELQMAWLVNPKTVLPAIVVVTVWRQFGLPMVLCFAGLQNIPVSLIESAHLDGANNRQILFHIYLPLIKPMIELSTMFTMLGGLRIYDTVVALTGGGPSRLTEVMPMWIVENAYAYSSFGYASALSVVFVIVVFIFLIIVNRVFRGEEYEY
ncbi:MAG: carbohydrate ABC transporter permease [Ruminiclostridium sp.]